MKSSARILLIVALLLPFRSALAMTGMFCHSGLPALPSPTAIHQGHGVHDAALHHAALHHAGLHDAGLHDAVDHASSSHDGHHGLSSNATPSCNLCSGICGAPPLPATQAVLHAPLPAGAERFPPMALPRVMFASSGPERPPRSI